MDRYVLTDGVRFIVKHGNGQYVADINENKALILPKKEAEKVLKNNLNKAFRKIFRLQKTDKEIVVETPPEEKLEVHTPLQLVETIDKVDSIQETATCVDEPEEECFTNLADIMEAAEQYLRPEDVVYKDEKKAGKATITCDEPVIIDESVIAIAEELLGEQQEVKEVEPVKPKVKKKKETKHYDTPIKKDEQFLTDMRMIAGYFRNASSRKKQLEHRLDTIEKEIVDIRHYIEFKSLNACEGYNAYKMLRQRLIARRECKNELRVMEVLTAGVFTAQDIANIENIINSFDTVVYKPRVLTSLFEEKEKTV